MALEFCVIVKKAFPTLSLLEFSHDFLQYIYSFII